ncbi:MAG: transglycosylase SLT domain-containing protein [Desulforhopalus sp.]
MKSLLLVGLEWLGLTTLGMTAVLMILGYFSNLFSGTDMFDNLLPFAGGIFALMVLASLLLTIWLRLRRWLIRRSPLLPPTVALCLTLLVFWMVPQGILLQTFWQFRALVGGGEEAKRTVLAHQVYASYRRLDRVQLDKMIGRAEQYAGAIEEAASTYDLDADLLKGLAAAESSYLPRESPDGGHGLFQITRTPAPVLDEVNTHFPDSSRAMNNHRYNAYLGAATFKNYLEEMNNDLFLGLLAYNIGPANGGLRFIMQRYGATDFTTIQPYLLQFPRDYPIRVLSYALAFRIKEKKGFLLPYEEGKNAMSIQILGIPGQ